MKFRTTLLLSVAVTGLVAMSSCTKSYTCHCLIKYSGYPGLPDSVVKEYTIIDSKSGATSKCTAESGTYSNTDKTIHTVENCYLY